ncbi:MAG: zf-HC2 domain-containing protein [Burkholderiales bacterium]
MIPDCKETSLLLSRRQDQPLDWIERIRLRSHLLICKACGNLSGQLDFLRKAVKDYRDRG